MSQVLITRREGAVLVLSNNNVAARNALSFEYYTAVTDDGKIKLSSRPGIGFEGQKDLFDLMQTLN